MLRILCILGSFGFGAMSAAAQVIVDDSGGVTIGGGGSGISVGGDGGVRIGGQDGVSVDSENGVTIGGSGVSVGGDGGVSVGDGGVSVGGAGGISVGGADGISIGEGGAVEVSGGSRVEENGSITLGSRFDSDALAEAMEAPGTPVNIMVLFDFGSADLTEEGKAQVALIADALSMLEDDARILIEGHTDSVGTDEANFALSNARAQAVANELMLVHDVSLKLLTGGKGESNPIASNNTDEGRSLNRRVTFVRN